MKNSYNGKGIVLKKINISIFICVKRQNEIIIEIILYLFKDVKNPK